MDMSEFQERCKDTAIYPGQGTDLGLDYTLMGLASEVGEVHGKRKKMLRDGADNREAMIHELGDCLYYTAMLASELGVPLSTVATLVLTKLKSRKERGTLSGDGDDR